LKKLAPLLLVGVAACAPTPESIQPAYVSEVPYQSWACQQLSGELGRLNNALSVASVQQHSARSNDVAGVIFLGLPGWLHVWPIDRAANRTLQGRPRSCEQGHDQE